jgi:hypothetical protein
MREEFSGHVRRKPIPRANGPTTEAFIIYDESSSPGAKDYMTPLEAGLSDGNLPLKKSSHRHTGGLCSNLPKYSIHTVIKLEVSAMLP